MSATRLPPPTDAARDAIIFLPGLGQMRPEESVEVIAQRLATALNQCRTDDAHYLVGKERGEEAYGDDYPQAGTQSIVRETDGPTKPVIDVYRMPYADALTGGFEKRSVFVRCLYLLLVLAVAFWKFLGVLRPGRGAALTAGQKLQLVLAAAGLSVLCAYTALLVWAAVVSIGQLAGVTEGTGAAAAADPAKAPPAAPAPHSWPQIIIILSTLTAMFLPRLRDYLDRSAVLLYSFINYLTFEFGGPRLSLIGQFDALLEHVRNKSGVPYRCVHVVSYSMGSVIALDALFPQGNAVENVRRNIDTLVTIGCPFDMIRTYWPTYFTAARLKAPGSPRRWINVYSPLDILGSNFRDDDKAGPPGSGIVVAAPQEAPATWSPDENAPYTTGPSTTLAPFIDLVTFVGFRSHGAYWDNPRFSCFSIIVPAMYETGKPAAPPADATPATPTT